MKVTIPTFLLRHPIPAEWSDEQQAKTHREIVRIARGFPGVLAEMYEIPRHTEQEERKR